MKWIALLLLLAACDDGSNEWKGTNLALTCEVGANARYVPATCVGPDFVIDNLNGGFIHLSDGSACQIRVVK